MYFFGKNNVSIQMSREKPNREIVHQVKTKLQNDGLLTQESIQELRVLLEAKKEKTSVFQFAKRRELKETIAALNYLLKKQPAPDS